MCKFMLGVNDVLSGQTKLLNNILFAHRQSLLFFKRVVICLRCLFLGMRLGQRNKMNQPNDAWQLFLCIILLKGSDMQNDPTKVNETHSMSQINPIHDCRLITTFCIILWQGGSWQILKQQTVAQRILAVWTNCGVFDTKTLRFMSATVAIVHSRLIAQAVCACKGKIQGPWRSCAISFLLPTGGNKFLECGSTFFHGHERHS